MTGRWFEDFSVGEEFITPARQITASDVTAFAALTGDANPIHLSVDDSTGRTFDRPIVHGALVTSLAMGLVSSLGLSHGTLVAMLEQHFHYQHPVFHGDTVQVTVKVLETRETRRPDRGIVRYRIEIRNGDGAIVVKGEWTSMMRRRPRHE